MLLKECFLSVSIIACFVLFLAGNSAQAGMSFKYYKIANAGNKMGQTSLKDVDKDGDLDWMVGCRSGSVWWFEYQSADKWVQHTIGGSAPTDVGGCAFDVDGDGWIDQVSGEAWYRNPKNPRSSSFSKISNGAIRTHDNMAADINGDNKLDVIAMNDNQLVWYKIPSNATSSWTKHSIGSAVHGGVDPAGVGDLDGDGDADVVRSNVWFENKDGAGTQWTMHSSINFGQSGGSYPYMTKSWVVDFDGDGDNDVVQTEGDCANGRVAWHENNGSGTFTRHMVDGGTNQDLHSLCVADFDNDGDFDIFSGGGPLTPAGTHKYLVWENRDGKGTSWTEHTIHSGARCHEAMCGDVDGDGDIDICSKPWNGDLHVYMRNMHVENGGTTVPRLDGAGRKLDEPIKINAVPNPFRTGVEIKLFSSTVPQFHSSTVQRPIKVFDLNGRLVSNQDNCGTLELQHCGTSYKWHARGHQAGTYVIMADLGTHSISKKVTLVK
jgi:hypothetical protein